MRFPSACALLLAAAALWIAGSLPALAAPAPATAAADALPAVEHNPPDLLHLAAGRPPAPRNPVSLRKAPGKPSGKTVQTSPKKQTTTGVSGIKPRKANAPKTTTTASIKKPISAKEKQAATERLSTVRAEFKKTSSGVIRPNGRLGDVAPGGLLQNGRLILSALQSTIPRYAPNKFKPDAALQRGFKYEWKNPTNGNRYQAWGHEANPRAPQGSVSRNHWTVRIQRTNGQGVFFLTTGGKWVKDSESTRHLTHLPLSFH